MEGRWIWVPVEKSAQGGCLGCAAGGIIFIIVIGFLYGLIKPDYEYSADENNEVRYFQYEHFVFFSGFSVTGEIQCKSEDENNNTLDGLNRFYFSGSYSNKGINAKLDSAGTVWNGSENIRIELPNDSTAVINGEKTYGGHTWINVPIF